MKSNKVWAICLFMLSSVSVLFGQKSMPKRDTTYSTVRNSMTDEITQYTLILPTYSTGQQGLMAYLTRSIRYPQPALAARAQATVVVQFMVELDGSLSDIRVVQLQQVPQSVNDAPVSEGSPYFSLQQEAIRVVQNMQPWWVGLKNGMPTRMPFSLPISFKLSH